MFGSNPKVFASTFVIMPLLYLLQMVPCVRTCLASASTKIATSCFLLILTLNVNWLRGIGNSLKRLFYEISHLGRFFDLVIFFKIFGRLIGLRLILAVAVSCSVREVKFGSFEV